MSEPGAGVSDEQLDQWENYRLGVGFAGLGMREQRALLGEVRASHAREAALQERIDKAEAEYRGLRRRITTVRCWTNEDGRQFVFADDVRAALAGTGDKA